MIKANKNILEYITFFLLFLHSCILGIITELVRMIYVKNLRGDSPLPAICNFIIYEISSPGYFSRYPVYFEFFITFFMAYACFISLFQSLKYNSIYLIHFIYFATSTILFNLILIVFLLAFNSMFIVETLYPEYEYTTLSIVFHYTFLFVFILLMTLIVISIFLRKSRYKTGLMLKCHCEFTNNDQQEKKEAENEGG